MPDKTFEGVYMTPWEDEAKKKTFMVFGSDQAKIPCLRNSLLYAVGAATTSGILINLATSRNTLPMSIGIFNVVLFGYWAQCRFFHRQYNKGAQKFKNPDYIQSLTMGRGGAAIDPSERWNQGRAMETPEQAERRLNRSGEVRNFRSDEGKGLTEQEAVFKSHESGF